MASPSRKSRSSGWNLYWVSSDGLEDCFVVARNSKSAMRVERDMNGFDYYEMEAHHACKIPEKVAATYLRSPNNSWPWYAHDDLLKKLKAEFRNIEGSNQVLINDIVYQQGSFPRKIGVRFLEDFKKSKITPTNWEEDRYPPPQDTLLFMLGACVARCQEIEHLIAHSFILSVSAKEKSKHETVNDLINSWKKKTFGQLIRTIEESYRLEDQFKDALEWFLKYRNKLIHGITMSEEFDIQTYWGQAELVVFLTKFEYISRAVRTAFRSCFYASIELGNFLFPEKTTKKIKLTRKQKTEASLFPHFFILLQD